MRRASSGRRGRRRRAGLVAAAVVATTLAACASGSLREAKNAYNRGDFAAARSAAQRAPDDPQARLIAARAATRLLGPDPAADTLALAAIARDLRAAARGYPFGDGWADRELATGVGEWLTAADLPDLASVYYTAALEAPGDDIDPGEAAAAEALVQAGLESLDRWDEGNERERAVALRELERPLIRRLEDTGWPYPPGLADQALRLAWHGGDHRAAWRFGAAGWLRAVAAGDLAAARVLAQRQAELVFPSWRESAADPALVDATHRGWDRAMRAWNLDLEESVN